MLFAMASQAAPSSGSARTQLAAGVAAIVLGVAILGLVPELRHCVTLIVHGRFAGLRSYVRSLGTGGLALMLGLMIGHAVVWYPSEIVTATAGYVYGFVPGLALVVVGWLLAALLTYALGYSVGRPVLQQLLGRRFSWLTTTMERGGTTLLLSWRLVPIVPFALLGYAAGATHVNLWRFSWTTVVGYLPLTTAVAFLGSRAQTLSVADPLVWVAFAGLIGLVIAQRFFSRRQNHPAAQQAALSPTGAATEPSQQAASEPPPQAAAGPTPATMSTEREKVAVPAAPDPSPTDGFRGPEPLDPSTPHEQPPARPPAVPPPGRSTGQG